MVQYDQAIVYKGTLDKINQKIANFKSINLDMTEFEKARDSIIKILESENVGVYQYSQKGVGLKQKDFFTQNYLKAVKNLETLYSDLASYDVYYNASSIFKLLKIFINNENKTDEEFTKVRNILITTLRNLLVSDSLDYKVEGPVIEDLCDMTYAFIKEEMSFYGRSETLEKIKAFDNYSYFISIRVANELSSLDLNNPKYLEVSRLKNALDATGVVNYTDSELIKAIATSSIDTEKKLKIFQTLDEKIWEYNDKMVTLESLYEGTKDKYNEASTNINKEQDELIKHIALLATSVVLSLSIGFSALFLAKKVSRKQLYATTTTLYNPTTNEEYTLSKEYMKDSENKVILHEYTPYKYQIDGRDLAYVRSDKQYDLSNIEEDLTFEEYLALDLKALGIEPEINPESKPHLDDKDRYKESYKIIEKIMVDLNDSKIENKNEFWWLLLFVVLESLLVASCEIGLEKLWHMEIMTDIRRAKVVRKKIKEVKAQRMSRKEYEEKLKELTKEMQEVCEACSEDIKEYAALCDDKEILQDERFTRYFSSLNFFNNEVKPEIATIRKLIRQ